MEYVICKKCKYVTDCKMRIEDCYRHRWIKKRIEDCMPNFHYAYMVYGVKDD